MKKLYFIASLLMVCALTSGAQAFRKGSLLVSVTEGSTMADYRTTNNNDGANDVINQNTHGDRDPLFVEYGLTKHWGIGMAMGTDLFNVNPSKFYGFEVAGNNVKATMSEVAAECNYHFLVTRRLDMAAFTSVGISSVSFKGQEGDQDYNYNSSGPIARGGIKVHYYCIWRFGITAMASAFAANCATDGIKGNTVGQGYTTTIKGAAVEFGLCYRIIH